MKGFFSQKAGLFLFAFWAVSSSLCADDQQIYVSLSPNGHYRVIVSQEIMRRVDDQVFFQYPIEVVNVRNHRHFTIQSGSAPFIHETDQGTFTIDWDLIHFDWAKDSGQFFFQLEVIEDVWRTYYVNIAREQVTDITPLLEAGILDKVSGKNWSCGTPQINLLQWLKPDLAEFKLSSICGKDMPIPNEKFSDLNYTVLFDTTKRTVVSDCLNCKDEKASKKFLKYWQSTQVTPTPTPDETPGAE
jgi:hypothetical protein